MLGTEHEGHVVESLAGNEAQTLGIDFQNLLALKLGGGHIIILTHLEKFLVFEFHICCYLFVS